MPTAGRKGPAFSEFKVVVLGEGRVGKTSLLARYVHNDFNDRQPATVQAAPFMARKLSVGTQQNWNVEALHWLKGLGGRGQERFHALGPIYYRGADAALLVFDITDVDSFTRIKAWVAELRQIVGPKIVLAIAANKCDLEAERKVSLDTVETYAKAIDARSFSTSAKTGAGLDLVFEDISKRILIQRHENGARTQSLGKIGSQPGRRHGGIAIVDEPSTPASKSAPSTCC